MNRFGKEALKSYLLLVLLITSILQVGILWIYQNHGFPSNFFTAIFPSHPLTSSTDGQEYFKPYRISVSGGNYAHWVIAPKRELYSKIWNEVKDNYLKSILLNDKPVPLSPEEQWGNIVTQKAVILSFKANIKADLLSWFLGISEITSKEASGVYKIAILPWKDINNNLTIYIQDETKIYKYITPIRDKWLTREQYDGIFDSLRQDAGLKVYNVITEINPGNKVHYPMSQDTLVIIGAANKSYDAFRSVICTAPDAFKIKDAKNISELDNLASVISGNDKDIYDSAPNIYGAMVLKNLNNLYRVYSDGLLEYKYLGAVEDSDKDSMSKAFKKAIEFIKARKQLISGSSLQLSGIGDKGRGYYEFTFDYEVGGIPVFTDYKSNGKDAARLTNAVTIRANSKRVINAWWVMKRFEQGSESKYNVNFEGFLDNTFKDYNTLKKDKDFFIRDINISYKIDSMMPAKTTLEPVWAVSAADGRNYVYPMQK